ncbi:MAG: MFS transporter [Anaerolineae bacterium]
MSAGERRPDRPHYGWVILFMSVVTVLGSLGFGRFGYTMILPSMKEGLALTYTQTGLLDTGNFIGYLTLALVGGFLASRYGPRLVITIFMFLISATMFLTGLASSFELALLWRTLTGVGSGGTNVPVMGLMSAWFGAKRRGLATGIAVSGSSFGFLITGFWLPNVTQMPDGWRYSWYYLAGLVFLIAILCFLFLRSRPEEKGLVAIAADEEPPRPASDKAGSLQWGLVYRSRPVWHLALIYIMFGFSYIIYARFFVAYLISEGGFTEQAAGQLLALAIGFLSIFCGLIWGTVSDLVGRKYGLAMVYFLQGLCFVTFGLWRSAPGYYLSAVLFGLTAWSIPAIMAAACGDYLGPRLAPAALGFITLFFGIGQALGPAVAGRIADVTGSFSLAFVIAGLAAFVGSGGSLLLRPPGELGRRNSKPLL